MVTQKLPMRLKLRPKESGKICTVVSSWEFWWSTSISFSSVLPQRVSSSRTKCPGLRAHSHTLSMVHVGSLRGIEMLTLVFISCRMPPHPFCLVQWEHIVYKCVVPTISAVEAWRGCIAKRFPENGCLCHVAIGYNFLIRLFLLLWKV